MTRRTTKKNLINMNNDRSLSDIRDAYTKRYNAEKQAQSAEDNKLSSLNDQKVAELENKNNQLKAEIAVKDQSITELTNKNQKLDKNLKTSQEEANELRSLNDQKVAELENKNNQLKEEIAVKDQSLTAIATEIEGREQDIDALVSFTSYIGTDKLSMESCAIITPENINAESTVAFFTPKHLGDEVIDRLNKLKEDGFDTDVLFTTAHQQCNYKLTSGVRDVISRGDLIEASQVLDIETKTISSIEEVTQDVIGDAAYSKLNSHFNDNAE